jgi:serine/threonine protein phosphatase PrpC
MMPDPAAGYRFVSHALTDVGLARRRNEDACLDRPDLGLWAVADGMGGHDAGDYASQAIVAALGALTPPADPAEFLDAAAAALTTVDAALRERAANLRPGAVIASTVVALLAQAGEFACLWAGDSRLYRWRDGQLQQLTTDHSRVQELLDLGLLRPEEAEGHPEGHVVTQAIGGGTLQFGAIRDAIHAGDRFLLCSDGLTNMVPDSGIAQELGAAPPREAAERLLERVFAGGALDNVTIVIVHAEPAAAHASSDEAPEDDITLPGGT